MVGRHGDALLLHLRHHPRELVQPGSRLAHLGEGVGPGLLGLGGAGAEVPELVDDGGDALTEGT